jgi:hypothetical protein
MAVPRVLSLFPHLFNGGAGILAAFGIAPAVIKFNLSGKEEKSVINLQFSC